ncbi:hypothetical protein RCL_jg13386.t1 [Rhizophagus clarus]|uniref:SMP domain-containing protein n=1 Tax=Rhizophagus clarus TaxID=94130 RepID=A0A8H3LQZ6_9GLOM|nr:hypothetical protein RCL_jg13386.t1 [Rhizophagus clarus]
MSRQYMRKPDVEALENAASTIQREEQKLEEATFSGGPAAKAKSFADRVSDAYDEPHMTTASKQNMKPSPQAVDDAARCIQREESKLYGGGPMPGGPASTAQSFAAKVNREENQQ